jgi:tetratricopeptide (TPR) repeat protein
MFGILSVRIPNKKLPRESFLAMICFSTRAVIALGIASVAFLGCTSITSAKPELLRSASVGGDNPFGGAPAVDVPSDAQAMSAFLKAEVAMNDGDREEALKDYAQAVQYDPSNAALKVRLATLYVRDGRLKEALEQVNQALAINPDSADARLLGAGISSATIPPRKKTTAKCCGSIPRTRKLICISVRSTPSAATTAKPRRLFSS